MENDTRHSKIEKESGDYKLNPFMRKEKRRTQLASGKKNRGRFSGQLLEKEPLGNHTTLGIGGPARYFLKANTADDVKEGIKFAGEENLPWYVMGNGSNILVPDDGFDGLIIKPSGTTGRVYLKNSSLWASAGESLPDLLRTSNRYGVSCFNFLAGIPATVGGAIAMNAGSFGLSISKLVKKIYYLDESLKIKCKKRGDCNFDYRESPFKNSSKIILGAKFKTKIDEEVPDLKKTLKIKKEKLPRLPSPGCVFKNPRNTEKSAGELIDRAGCKGLSFGDAAVSKKHANFIINKGDAKGEEVMKLIRAVRKRVQRQFGVRLTTEIEILLDPVGI